MAEIIRNVLGPDGAEISIRPDDSDETVGSVTVTGRGKRCKIGILQIKPAYRGQNLGETLLKEGENWAVEQKLPEIYMNIIPVPGSAGSLLNMLRKNDYEVNLRTGIAKKKLFQTD